MAPDGAPFAHVTGTARSACALFQSVVVAARRAKHAVPRVRGAQRGSSRTRTLRSCRNVEHVGRGAPALRQRDDAGRIGAIPPSLEVTAARHTIGCRSGMCAPGAIAWSIGRRALRGRFSNRSRHVPRDGRERDHGGYDEAHAYRGRDMERPSSRLPAGRE
jgi:hypothetical protein